MKRRKRRPLKVDVPRPYFMQRIKQFGLIPIAVLLCLAMMGSALAGLSQGRFAYYNYQGLIVYAPYAVLGGVLALAAVLVLWKKSRASKS